MQSVATTLAAGADNQAFCYDEQNRLTWAGAYSTAQSVCGGGQYTPGTLSSAFYSTGHSYDPRNRLASATGTGGAGTYTYGDATPLDAATSTTSGYGASYDAAGDMVCRAPTSASTCAGSSPTGQQLTYDRERRLIGWQSAPNNPATTIAYAYDGEGNRVAQSVTSGGTNGTTTTTDYIAKGLEEQTGSSLIKYESVPGVISAEITGSGSGESVAYLATDGLGSVSEAFDGRGNVLGRSSMGRMVACATRRVRCRRREATRGSMPTPPAGWTTTMPATTIQRWASSPARTPNKGQTAMRMWPTTQRR